MATRSDPCAVRGPSGGWSRMTYALVDLFCKLLHKSAAAISWQQWVLETCLASFGYIGPVFRNVLPLKHRGTKFIEKNSDVVPVQLTPLHGLPSLSPITLAPEQLSAIPGPRLWSGCLVPLRWRFLQSSLSSAAVEKLIHQDPPISLKSPVVFEFQGFPPSVILLRRTPSSWITPQKPTIATVGCCGGLLWGS